jgi:hypothetical protein
MKFYNTFKSFGGYTTVEWSSDEMFNYQMIIGLIFAYILSILSIIASGICIFLTLADIERQGVKTSIYGALMSGYYLLDVYNDWILNSILKLFLSDQWYHISLNLNIIYFVTHIFLLLFSATIYYNTSIASQRKTKLVTYTVYVFVFAFFFVGGSRGFFNPS